MVALLHLLNYGAEAVPSILLRSKKYRKHYDVHKEKLIVGIRALPVIESTTVDLISLGRATLIR